MDTTIRPNNIEKGMKFGSLKEQVYLIMPMDRATLLHAKSSRGKTAFNIHVDNDDVGLFHRRVFMDEILHYCRYRLKRYSATNNYMSAISK